MSWISFTGLDGEPWQVNQDGLYLLARASVRAELARRHTHEHRSGEGWFDGPEIIEIHTEWGTVNRETDQRAADLYRSLASAAMANPENAARNLALILEETRRNQNHLRDMQRNTLHRNSESVSRHVSNWQTATDITRFVRDASWTTLIVLSALPTGGATAAGGAAASGTGALALSTGARVTALGVGSIGRGQATYQDTGNVGAAVVSGGGSFITGAMGLPAPAGAAMSSANQAVLLGLQTVTAGGLAGLQGLAEGKSGETAAWQAVSAAGFNLAGGMISNTQAFANMSVPMRFTVQMATDSAGSAANSAIGDTTAASPPPRTTGRLTFGGVPPQPSGDAAHIQDTVLRPH
ncbi:MAG: hypothetical protein AAGK71_11730 [Pseudomonadota bacterium]